MVSRADPHAIARLAAIVEWSFDAIVSKDLNSIITSWNPAAARLFGYTEEEAVGQSVRMLIPEHLQAEEETIIERIKHGEAVESFETTRVRKDGTLIAVSITISPIKNARGRIIGASKIARDITVAKEHERRIRLLMREVNHRVKNQFAVILSMVRETTKRSTDPAELESQIRERIMALSRSHDLLVTSDWTGASLRDLVLEHLRPFGHEDRISVSGPDITLQSNAVQALGMAFHELGTNSAKYGALAHDMGKLTVGWMFKIGSSGKREMALSWEEVSPGISAAEAEDARKGFGTVVLKRVAPQALSGASVLEHEAGRYAWRLEAPLESVAVQSPLHGTG
ncbi:MULTISPECIES: PAS domain S-box protein [Mesorhizobium]|uniref:Blue-light-activated histidine kinase n=1 Tax=Mesorhizobium denitrificans TaxID=2294114 RepID=A0A371XF62_9HYPH|nr:MULTISPECIES: PAS domain S-box protein [Mesorhizobium]RFC67869.1 PAS domain S-box protein [Mesorhizobium denitrificans]